MTEGRLSDCAEARGGSAGKDGFLRPRTNRSSSYGVFFCFFLYPQVYVDVPGGLNLSLSLPLVIGTIPLHACATRTSSISSNCSSLSWLGLQERPEGVYSKLNPAAFISVPGRSRLRLSSPNATDAAPLSFLHAAAPPSYSDLAISESQRRDCLQGCDSSCADDDNLGSLQTYITEFRYLPPPLYSEVQLTHHAPAARTHARTRAGPLTTSQELCEQDKPRPIGRRRDAGA